MFFSDQQDDPRTKQKFPKPVIEVEFSITSKRALGWRTTSVILVENFLLATELILWWWEVAVTQ